MYVEKINSLEKINNFFVNQYDISKNKQADRYFTSTYTHKLYIDAEGYVSNEDFSQYLSGGIVLVNITTKKYIENRKYLLKWIESILGNQYVKDYQDNVDFSVRKSYASNEYIFDYDSKNRIISIYIDVFEGRQGYLQYLKNKAKMEKSFTIEQLI